jgi:hypothetical protein
MLGLYCPWRSFIDINMGCPARRCATNGLNGTMQGQTLALQIDAGSGGCLPLHGAVLKMLLPFRTLTHACRWLALISWRARSLCTVADDRAGGPAEARSQPIKSALRASGG